MSEQAVDFRKGLIAQGYQDDLIVNLCRWFEQGAAHTSRPDDERAACVRLAANLSGDVAWVPLADAERAAAMMNESRDIGQALRQIRELPEVERD